MNVRACPRDSTSLEHRTIGATEVDVCTKCRGMFLDRGELEKVAPGFHAADLRAIGGTTHIRALARCPGCGKRMIELRYGPTHARFVLDRCIECGGLWLDEGELEAMAEAGAKTARINARPLLKVDHPIAQDEFDVEEWSPEASVALVAGLPIELERQCGIRPWGTYGLLALNVLAFVATAAGGTMQAVFEQWGMAPGRILLGEDLATLVTSLFLHAGLLHLLGNGYFLYVFGDDVEERVGTKYFVPYYIALGIAANLVSIALGGGNPMIPHVGASGAIAGLMGTYLVLYPRSQFLFVARFSFYLSPVRMPAWAFLFYWIIFQVFLSLIGHVPIDTGAHLGGFAAGVLCGAILRKSGTEAELEDQAF